MRPTQSVLVDSVFVLIKTCLIVNARFAANTRMSGKLSSQRNEVLVTCQKIRQDACYQTLNAEHSGVSD